MIFDYDVVMIKAIQAYYHKNILVNILFKMNMFTMNKIFSRKRTEKKKL